MVLDDVEGLLAMMTAKAQVCSRMRCRCKAQVCSRLRCSA